MYELFSSDPLNNMTFRTASIRYFSELKFVWFPVYIRFLLKKKKKNLFYRTSTRNVLFFYLQLGVFPGRVTIGKKSVRNVGNACSWLCLSASWVIFAGNIKVSVGVLVRVSLLVTLIVFQSWLVSKTDCFSELAC